MLKRFSEIGMKDVSTCGGKGASLGEMKNAGFPIPDGFVLTTKAFGKDSVLWEKEVLAAFDKLGTKFVAVRSSGTKEDGADDSFAGQFDTYLFVTRDTLIQKIKECHGSVKSERILSYCKYKGIDNDSITVAVVVQKMVNSDAAGVCFTVNPISGESDEVMIEAGFGVGEAVVSGMITPDNYVVNMTTGTVEKNISKQEKKLVLDDMGGTREVEINLKDQTSQKLSDKHIGELSEFAKKIENHYGKPMDTEWAVENGKLFILQARPITTELKHNIYDEVAAERQSDDWFLMEEVKGARPFILSGRGRRLTERYNEEFNLPIEDVMVYKDNILFLYVKHHQLYLTAKAMLQKSLSDVNFLSSISQRNKKIQNDTFLYCDELQKINLKEKTDQELMQIFGKYMEQLEIMITIGRVDCILEFENEMFSTTLRNYLAKRIKEKGLHLNVAEVFSVFTTPCEKTRGIIQEESLQAIANEIKKDPKTLNFFLENSIETIANDIEKLYPTINAKLEEHTKKFNWYFYMYEGPARDKGNFIAELRQLLTSKKTAQDENVNLVEAKAELIKKLDINDYYQKLLKSAEEMVFNKDLRKHALYRMSYVGFNFFEEVAKRCNISVEEVWNLTPREIQQLTIDEIKNLDLKSRDNGMMIKFYKGEYETDFDPKNANKFMEEVSEKNKLTGNITTLQGSCAYQGKVVGKVRIVDAPEDMKNFKEGEILVSHQTDPDILPAMKLASAFVTDLGGITCHAAIVSREMKKPCIVGTKFATQVLKDGDLVEVDANNGIVKIIENGEKNNLELEILGKTYTPDFWEKPEVFFNYQGVPFYTSVFAKCYSLPVSKRSTPTYYISEFKEGGIIIQYVSGDFVKKGYNIINDLLEGNSEGSDFLAENDKRIVDCFEKCKEYIKVGKTNFLDIWKEIEEAFANGRHIFNFSHALQDYLSKLKEDNINLYQTISNNISAPEKTFINKAGEYLKELVAKNPNNFDEVYKKFIEEYGRFQNSYLGVNRNITKEWLKNYYNNLQKEEEKENKGTNLSIPEKYKSLVNVAGKAIIYQDNKKKLGLIAYEIMDKRLLSVSKKTKIHYEDLLWLTVNEILSYNLDSKDDIRKIEEKILKYKTEGVRYGIMIDTGYIDIAKEFWDKVVEINSVKAESNEIKGTVGNKGKVVGKAKIILSIKKDGNKLKEGDILVTGMTRPEFLPLMQKAAAFVTDEGGITCHAAIVSRELGKPCVIGTKIATQTLKDGDLVEVDADNGIVRKLGSKKDNQSFMIKDGNKIFTPEFRARPDHIHFSYQGVPFFSCIFSKCCTTKDTKRTTPANYVCEFNNLETVIQYVVGDFVEKGENMINNMLQGKNDASIFLKKQDDIVKNCIKECEKYIKGGKTDFLSIWNEIKLAFEAGCHVINLSYGLQKYLINLKETNPKLHKSISENIVATKKSFVNQAGDYLKQLLSEYPNDFDKVYDKFMEEYGWFQNSYLGINPIGIKRLKKYSEDLLKIPTVKNTKQTVNFDKKYKILVKTASDAIIYQDNKKKLGFMSMQIMENWLRDYAKKIKVSFEDLLWLTVEEILDNNIQTIKDKIKEYKHNGKRWGIMTERGYMDISKDFRGKVTELNRPKESIKSFNGITGCKGKYVGKVKIIANIEKDKDKFKKGDILVTGMTRPEFVPLLKEAGGIITNEGGITCHAAIISRELGIPCIIGTKIATQVLKDGDLVEVDADNGVVKILS